MGFISLDDVVDVGDRLYREYNPMSKKDTPSYLYEKVEAAQRRRLAAGSELSLYEWCKKEIENRK